jgi:hypothetical protein
MYLVELIKNHLKQNKSCRYLPKAIDNNTIQVVYNLSIPNWVNDKEVLTQDNMNIMYSKYIPSKENDYTEFHHHYYVTKKNADEAYPLVGNKKWFRVFKDYKVEDLINKDIMYYFFQEAELALREIKSYILLQKIGDLSGKWEAVNAGQPNNYPVRFNYAYSKMNYSTPSIEPCPIFKEEEQPIDFNINAI